MLWSHTVAWLFFLLCPVLAEFKPKVKLFNTVQSTDNNFLFAFDDSTVLLQMTDGGLQRSEDNGWTWSQVKLKIPTDGGRESFLIVDKNYAGTSAYFAVGEMIYSTADQGKTWEILQVPEIENAKDFEFYVQDITSHPTNKNLLIMTAFVFNNEKDTGFHSGTGHSYLSIDGSTFKEITSKDSSISKEGYDSIFDTACYFVRKSKASTLLNEDSIICEVSYRDSKNVLPEVSKFFFTDTSLKRFEKVNSELENMNAYSLFILENHVIAMVIEDKYNRDSAMSFWVLDDESNGSFEKLELPTQVRGHAEILELENKIIIQYLSFPSFVEDDEEKIPFFEPIAEAFISDSHGRNFKVLKLPEETIDRGMFLSTLTSLKKIIFASYMTSLSDSGAFNLHSGYSVDLGETWKKLAISDPDNRWSFPCDISDVDRCNFRSIYLAHDTTVNPLTAVLTPGIVIGVGQVGEDDSPFTPDLDTFISRDDGATWEKIFDFPTISAFGDYGNIVISVPFDSNSDSDPLSEFYYSLDQGKTFKEYQLDTKIVPVQLIPTALDGSGSSFVLQGIGIEDKKGKVYSTMQYVIDLSEAYDGRKCEEKDMEDWFLANGQCIDGVKIKFRRRKYDATCLVHTLYDDLSYVEEECECTYADYECSNEFSTDDNENCVPDYKKNSLTDACQGKKSISLLPKRLKKNNKCKNPLSLQKQEISCGIANEPHAAIKITENEYDTKFKSYQYFDTFSEETILFRTHENEVYVSHNSGENINKVQINGDKILEINFNPYFNSSAYLFGEKGKLYITNSRGRTFKSTQLPEGRELGFPLSFSAKNPNAFIYYSGENCDSFYNPKCHSVAYLTTNGGASFQKMLDGAINCEFLGSTLANPKNQDTIVCEVKDKESGKKKVVSSTDFFSTQKTLYEDTLGFMSTGDYLVVAVSFRENELKAYLTVDGEQYSEAILPPDLRKHEQTAFTILGSQEGAIFMHMTINAQKNEEYGALLKSNSEGSSFVVLERAVNRDNVGFVDFEKIEGLEGIIVINTVSDVESGEKHLKTKITFNDGADWSYIKPPKVDSEGKRYDCKSSNLNTCSLNLHGYTERKDVRDTFSSGSALGYMFALGNVGEYLLPLKESSTYMTTDGGVSWIEVKKGTYQWEYGDHGNVIVLVKDGEKTDSITYSINGGKSWAEKKFTQEEVLITDIITVPRDSAMRFLLLSELSSVKGTSTKTFTLDFSAAFTRQCTFSGDSSADFEYVSLNHPNSKECLFGHKAEYLKKKSEDCFIGMAPIKNKFKIVKNCSCTRNDFECDFNYLRSADGTCKLENGLQPSDPLSICERDSSIIEYFEPTGYRKIPLSTCKGGLILEKTGKPHACPGKEKEFKEKYNVSSASFFIFWFVAFALLSVILGFIYNRGIKRNGGFSRFGEIRLGDDDLIEENSTDRIVNRIVRGGVFALSGTFTVFNMLKREVGNTYKKIAGRLGGGMGPSYQSLLHDQFLDDADDLLAGHDEDADDLASFIEQEGNFEIGNEEEDLAISNETHAPYTDNPEPVDSHESD